MQERVFPTFPTEYGRDKAHDFVEKQIRKAIKLRHYYEETYNINLPHDILVIGPGYFIHSRIAKNPNIITMKDGELAYAYGELAPDASLEALFDSLGEHGIKRRDAILFIGDHDTWNNIPDQPVVKRISDDYSVHGYQFEGYPPQVFHVFNAEYIYSKI